MPTHFDLIITADHSNLTAEFRLLNANGGQLAYRQTDFKTISASRQQGLFDLRNYLRLYAEEGRQSAAAAEIGVCIAEEVLGGDIFEELWESKAQRTLRIQLPGASQEENYLAAALARVPWEIARPSPDRQTLGERNLLVRVVHDTQAPPSDPMELAPEEPLRVLFVFAEARGSSPLGARQERLDLLRLFEREIYPQRRVVAHFLTHGVTRERLESQIRDNGGYHIVHWSGHGHLNLLELAKPGGAKDRISGEQLLDLFTDPDVGGFIPRFFFLSACHSGDILRVKDWADFLAVAQGKEAAAKQVEEKQLEIEQQPGFTGTAHALLQGGVPSVVAMRYAVRERIRAWMAQQPQDRGEWTENTIRMGYADRLAAVFESLQHQNMTAALEAGSQAVVYCVQAEDWERLGGFASNVVNSSQDPRLIERLIPHLRTAVESAPEGRPRWRCLCSLADALERGGRPDASLSFYEQAATQARAAAQAAGDGSPHSWADVAWITGNWAAALYSVGNLPAARERHMESAEAHKKAGSPAVNVIVRELEALRIDITEGKVAEALPQVESRLAQVAGWWGRRRSGQPVPEAPEAEFLARAYITALDISREADYAREDWESALRRLDTALEIQRALERTAEDIARDRYNRANVLVELPGRFGEARAELEDCLQVFQDMPKESSSVLSSLADLFSRQGDVPQAITQERRALAVREQLPEPDDRAISHYNLAIYLERQGTAPALAESTRHQLAALIYFLVAGLGQSLQTLIRNYVIHFRRARSAGTELAVPRVAELLADPTFHPLDSWLRQRHVSPAELQMAVDRFLEQARQAAADA